MFEFFFKYPFAAFSKGQVLLAARWPVWVLLALILVAAGALAWPMFRRGHAVAPRVKPIAIWLLQTTMVAMLLVLLWQPALSVATLRPQQNIVAVVVDDSKSMSIVEDSASRMQRLKEALSPSVVADLQKKFQVRFYRLGARAERVETTANLKGDSGSTRLGDGLREVSAEAASLPIGAVVLLSDGADNAGGIDLETTNQIRRFRIPVHTVGFGKEKPDHDIEVTNLELPQRVLATSRLNAQVSVKQWGFANKRAKLTLRDGDKILSQREITLKADGIEQTESVSFNSGNAGVRSVQASIEPIGTEENDKNNAQTRLLTVEPGKPRILYIEGEPKWEYKFIRRAIELDQGLQLVSMVRTTQNKFYRQGIEKPEELEQGFPATVEELFNFQGIVIGGVEAAYFTPNQQELLKQFVDRRGGGVLWLGGRGGLADGGWAASPLAELLPTVLPNRKNTFQRDPAYVELAAAGRDSLICRLDEDPARNGDRWKKLPYLANYEDPGTPKPGAVVLAEMNVGRNKMPLLTTQNYGRGRTALFATSGSWRWQMQQPLEDMSHEMFWQQMLRWLVSGTTGPVVSSVNKSVYNDEQSVPLRAEIRDRNYNPAADAAVEARIVKPDGSSETVTLRPDPGTPGVYTANWGAAATGAYVVETVARRGDQELGRDAVTFRREDGVAENFGTHQNKELLEKLAQQTGGRYWQPSEVKKLAGEINYSEAGISIRETRDLWDAPIFFLMALLLRGGEWLLRRKWGVV
ncbi:MAG: glutamine amidotransferase [Bryobacteraceae bacterium]|nr:glutamine amidotransferase [Bryobacteraceae bacterium]